MSENGPSFFLKQADDSNPSAVETVRIEAEVYRRFEANASGSMLERITPRFLLFDASHNLIVLDFIPHARSLSDLTSTRSRHRREAEAELLARAMARYHADTSWSGLPARLPFTFDVLTPGPEMLRTITRGQVEVVRILQAEPDMLSLALQLRQQFTFEGLVHGDLRFDNILITGGSRKAGGARAYIVDWELATTGDRAWDIGSVFEQYLGRCLSTIEVRGPRSVATISSAFASAVPSIQRDIRAFWHAYLDHGIPDTSASLLARAASYTGLRLLQSAFEWSASDTVPPVAGFAMQLGLNIVRRPEEAADLILGITRAGTS
jgi:hypothetical protein